MYCDWRSHVYLVMRIHCVCGSVYCALYVRMCVHCEWFLECAMRALVGSRGVG